MVMPGREFSPQSGYRYGFNGKENDNEAKGEGNALDFGSRIYDPRTGRWLSVDAAKAPWQSPYIFVSNSPSGQLDPDGKWQTDGHYWTVMLVALMLEIPDAEQLAYYAEYPDTKIHGYKSEERYTWGIPGVQQGTHSLTGGHGPTASLKATREILKADFKKMQELGRLLHKLGDTYAHRVIGGDGQLYGNPFFTIDHAASDGDKPDLIKNRMDDGIFEGYVRNLAGVLSTKYEKYDNEKITKAVNKLLELGEYAKKNNVSLKGIINYEVAAIKGESKFFIHQPTSLMNSTDAKPLSEHTTSVKNTSKYLTDKGIKFTTKEIYETVTETSTDGRGYTYQTQRTIFRGTEFQIQNNKK
jgi:RHS repeat-associated protein